MALWLAWREPLPKAAKAAAPPPAQSGLASQEPGPKAASPLQERRLTPAFAQSRGLTALANRLMTEAGGTWREAQIQALVEGTPPAKLALTLALLQTQMPPGELRRELTGRLLRRWSETAPGAAGAWADQMLSGAERTEALNLVAVTWANQNLPDATAWVRGWSNSQEREAGLLSVAYEAARTEPITALNLGLDLPASQSRDDLLVHGAAQWAASEPERAVEWGQQVPDSQLRQRVLRAVTIAWGDSDPVAAGTLAVSALPPGKAQEDAVMGILLRWVQKDPEAARNWAEHFPEGPLRSTAEEELAKFPAPDGS